MVWAQLDINKPHLVYIILGGFTSLFMLCSSVIKEQLYIGEATVATICGIIFGPHAANLIDPGTWGNTDQITLEFARIVLVVQCFAVGVELPKAYMERHWRSVLFLLVPVMTFGWLVTSLFVWGLIPGVNWLDSLCIAACVTATDPVLASSVVGKGKFAKRVPKHLRDLLSAESGCNDGMAFPFIYLALYVIQYRHHPNEVALHWICLTVLYECVFGAFYGFVVGYIARRAIRAAHERDLIDRESFLVYYFVLALFCAGSGSMLGMDDLLIGFACGVGFSNDGWFTEKTEEAHVSNVIDLLINLAFFVYFGTIIPWQQYNSDVLGLNAWRLVVIGILVLLFRRIPIMLALKPFIPDIKTWREALFAGHFGPIGVGAIFVAILARAELETETTTPLEVLPPADFPHDNIIELIWPVTTFLVICSIIVHGSSIAVFTLGKHINTLTLTMSYTTANEDASWMDRLPRIASRSKSSMSARRPDDTESDMDEKVELGNGNFPRNFLRRQREEDTPSRSSSGRPISRRRQRESSAHRHGGPVSQSAIAPMRSSSQLPPMAQSDSDSLTVKESDEGSEKKERRGRKTSPTGERHRDDEPDQPDEPQAEIFEEGDQTVYEDEEGNVLEVEDTREEYRGREASERREKHERQEGVRLMSDQDVHHGIAHAQEDPKVDEGEKILGKAKHNEDNTHRKDDAPEAEKSKDKTSHPAERPSIRQRMSTIGHMAHMPHLGGLNRHEDSSPKKEKAKPERRGGAARAYQFGNTIIVEDEDGEVIKKYEIPAAPKKNKKEGEVGTQDPARTRQRVQKMSSYLGVSRKDVQAGPSDTGNGAEVESKKKKKRTDNNEAEDDNVRFTISGSGGRMSKADFIKEIQKMDPKSRARLVENSDVPEAVKQEARADAKEQDVGVGQQSTRQQPARQQSSRQASGPAFQLTPPSPEIAVAQGPGGNDDKAKVKRTASHENTARGPEGLTLIDSNDEDIPFHDVTGDLQRHSRQESTGQESPAQRRRREAHTRAQREGPLAEEDEGSPAPGPGGETAAERRRRLGALGHSKEVSDSEAEESASPDEPPRRGVQFAETRQNDEARSAAPGPSTQPSDSSENAGSKRPVQQSRRGDGETAAEKRRREGALGHSKDESDSDDDDTPRIKSPGIRFAEITSPSQAREQSSGGFEPGSASRRRGFFNRKK